MDAGSPPGKKGTNPSPSHSRIRETEDDERFGHCVMLTSPRFRQKLQTQKNAFQTAQKEQLKKRPRSSSFSKYSYSENLESFDNKACRPKKHTIEISERNKSQMGVYQKRQVMNSYVEESRKGCSPSPRTYEEIIGKFTPMKDTSKLNGVSRLSSLALNAARTWAARGKLVDLSDLADSHVDEILGHRDLTPAVLMNIESLNPSRINVIEATWARLVLNEFEERELPPKVNWWRTFYEMKKREQQIALERARARLKQRYDAADANKRRMKTTRVIGVAREKKTKSPTKAISRIAQLRMEMKRERRKR